MLLKFGLLECNITTLIMNLQSTIEQTEELGFQS
jgi:hypothetical protein